MTFAATASDGQTIIWQPQKGPQEALISCPVFEVCFGGARGGGKTEASIGDWLQHSDQYGAHAVGIFVRRTLKQLEEVIARTQALFPLLGARYNTQNKTWKMPKGARLKFVYLEKDSDAENYQGHSYTRVYVEEATNFPNEGPIAKLRATLRSAHGVPCGMRLTCNPGGPGHLWVKARYIDPCRTGYKIIEEEEVLDIDGEKITVKLARVFIPSKISDNTLLLKNDPAYILRLKQSGGEKLVKAWLEGDWDSIEGTFFSEWNSEVHVLGSEWLDRIPRKAIRFRAMDWGSAKPFSIGWYVVSDGTWGLPRGALVKYKEWYGCEGKPNVGLKMTAADVADGIKAREKMDGFPIRYGIADPSIFIRDGGPSIMEMMNKRGVQWRRGDNRRTSGAEMMHIRLTGEGGRPMLYFIETCEDSIRTIPALQHDETKIEDVDTDMEDHAYDETRYAIMSRPWLPKDMPADAITFPKNPDEMTINELIGRKTAKRRANEQNWS